MTTPSDFGFDLLPPDPNVISADLALDAAVAPVIDLGTDDELPLGKGWSFDFPSGQFVRHGASPAEVYEVDNLRMWIEKTLRTAKYAHPIYGASYGMEDPTILIGEPPDGDLLSAYQDDVVAALMVHDRIAAVDSFSFQHDPLDDAVYVSFVVTLDSPGDDESSTQQIESFRVS